MKSSARPTHPHSRLRVDSSMKHLHGQVGMHVRSVAAALVLAVAIVSLPARARAQGYDPMTDGLVPGDYLRIGVSSVTPVNPSGSLKDWKRGVGFGVLYENWDNGNGG